MIIYRKANDLNKNFIFYFHIQNLYCKYINFINMTSETFLIFFFIENIKNKFNIIIINNLKCLKSFF
jgi:hypothetical protein